MFTYDIAQWSFEGDNKKFERSCVIFTGRVPFSRNHMCPSLVRVLDPRHPQVCLGPRGALRFQDDARHLVGEAKDY